MPLKLGVNIDHVATLRQARYCGRSEGEPSPVEAALVCESAGALGITAHLREDRRHIQDHDVVELRRRITTRLNLEMGNTPEIVEFALKIRPEVVCLVPERRQEVTTEGGLDAAGQHNQLAPIVTALADANIRVSLFIEPDVRQIDAAIRLRAPVVEFHTGKYAHLLLNGDREGAEAELKRIADAAALAAKNGIEPHAGHGLTFENVVPIAAIPQLAELNIGHYLIGEGIFIGLEAAILKMRALMDEAR